MQSMLTALFSVGENVSETFEEPWLDLRAHDVSNYTA
jgi:hypothetical protein